MRTRNEAEGAKRTSSEIDRLGVEILGLREQLNCAAEMVVLKNQQPIKLDKNY